MVNGAARYWAKSDSVRGAELVADRTDSHNEDGDGDQRHDLQTQKVGAARLEGSPAWISIDQGQKRQHGPTRAQAATGNRQDRRLAHQAQVTSRHEVP